LSRSQYIFAGAIAVVAISILVLIGFVAHKID
jgi:hypothetical protein